MTTDIMPRFPGQMPPKRSEIWSDDLQESASGSETVIQRWTYPRWKWVISHEALRQAGPFTEYDAFVDFTLRRVGRVVPFLYRDEEDNTATNQLVGLGDGVTTDFQLVRSYGGAGGFPEPMFAPDVVSAVRVAGVALTAGSWSVQTWGDTSPGLLTLAAAPGNGAAISVDFTYFFPCRFATQQIDFEKVMKGWHKMGELAFTSIKRGDV
ncbi:MAG: DUF2460 domain-containing protein [Magnetospirillum sp.]|nr:DUF2460 domain-containing protein [Magnetospirillum sp.]